MLSLDQIRPFLENTLDRTDFADLGKRYEGKVRDVYSQGNRNILIATDRQSAFDIKWCTIPLKGQVLNQLSAWWFERIKDVMPTHVLAMPDPNVTVVKNLKMLKVEIVVRAYLTGSTKTSAWVNYAAGVRNFCGNPLPEGMKKNQPFVSAPSSAKAMEGRQGDRVPIITPTTKAEDDELIDPAGIIARGLATTEQWAEIAEKAFALFRRGQEVALKRGLILVDTKYEMGYDEKGTLTIADEVHTPDSSRYWVASTYEERFANGQEPEALDKEFFRLWLREQGFEYGKPKPIVTDDARVMLAQKYISLYEKMTGEEFQIEQGSVVERICENLASYRVKAGMAS
ncbi:MAG: phosphoribosylaminoimidazolesuccinocarboxamide synthase, partial [Patescibacteria group bacterium]